MIGLVTSLFMLNPCQSIRRKTGSTIAALEETGFPAEEPGFVIKPNSNRLPSDRGCFDWSMFISNVTQNPIVSLEQRFGR
jgi:hypothetical protein